MLDQEAFQTTIRHSMEIWFEPDIRRRQEAGLAPTPFLLRAAQVILHADGRPHIVRLNEEVQILAQMKLKAGVRKQRGDAVYMHEVDGLSDFKLPDSEDPNCGHFTLVLIGEQWHGAFDFRYNKGQAREYIQAADEFLATAERTLRDGHLRVSIDTLFSAAELAASAYIATAPVRAQGRSHSANRSAMNMMGHLGNLDQQQVAAYNSLHDLRPMARYVKGELAVTPDRIESLLDDVRGLLDFVRECTE